ncbi:MAG TPA: hypothetical protein VMH32_08125 [Burkholderiales bacterium]|nr:hypothetical protein [Burkholderiales bacterium]
MLLLRLAVIGTVVVLCVYLQTLAHAQIPPHQPGSICSTPRLWCWAQPPGQAGQQCVCQGPYGPVAGRLI